jgi:integrase
MVPLTVDAVARFWSSFRTSRDLAIVGLMLLHGLRSCEVLALNREDVHVADSQIQVLGKSKKIRILPLTPESLAARGGTPSFLTLPALTLGTGSARVYPLIEV